MGVKAIANAANGPTVFEMQWRVCCNLLAKILGASNAGLPSLRHHSTYYLGEMDYEECSSAGCYVLTEWV